MTPAPARRSTRAGRAGAGVGAAVLVAFVAHTAGGGAAPDPLLLGAVLSVAWPAGLLLVGRRPSLPRQAAVVAAAQGLLHAVFALGSPSTAVDAGGMAGMHGGALPPVAVAPQHGGTMPLAHLLGAVVTVAAWRWGEAALHGLLERLPVRRLLALFVPVVTAPGALRPAVPLRIALPAAAALAAHRDRGPPLFA